MFCFFLFWVVPHDVEMWQCSSRPHDCQSCNGARGNGEKKKTLPVQEKVALRMPLSISHEDGEPLYLLLKKSLNGLRNVSYHCIG